MESVHFLNIEYIMLRIFDAFTNTNVSGDSAMAAVAALVHIVWISGLVLAFIILILLVYVRIRLEQVEHAGFHHLEEEERRRQAQAERTGTNDRWDVVVALASSSSESDWRRAIVEADIILASVLAERGYTGESVGDQLKLANPLQFTTIDLAWEAHKMRNALAHLGEAFPLTERDARATIDLYRRVFEEFGVV